MLQNIYKEILEGSMILSTLEELINIHNLTNDILVDFISKKARSLGCEVCQDKFDNCVLSCYPKEDASDCTLGEVGIVIPLCSLNWGKSAKVLENNGMRKNKQNVILNLGEKSVANLSRKSINSRSKYLVMEDSSPRLATLCKVAVALNLIENRAKTPFKIIFTSQEDGKFVGANMLDISKINCRKFISIEGGEYARIFISNYDSSLMFCKLNMNKIFVNKDAGFKTFKLKISCQPKIKRNFFGKRKIVDVENTGFSSLCSLAKFLSKDKFLVNSINYIDTNKIECVFSTFCDELKVKAKLLGEYILQKGKYAGLKIDCARQADNFLVVDDTENFIKFATELCSLEQDLGAKMLNFESNKGEICLQVLSNDKKDLEEKENKLKTLSEKFGAKLTTISTINHFETSENSALVEALKSSYVGFEEVKIERGNFASQLSIFQKKVKNCECVCISPKVLDENLHGERVEYASIMNLYLWLKNLVCVE